MNISLYEKELGASTIPEALTNGSIAYVNGIFDKSPSYKKVFVDGLETEVWLNHTKKYNELGVLFRPLTIFNRGSYVESNQDVYMLTEFIQNEIYPKGKLELCNSNLKWKDESQVLQDYKCIVKGSFYDEEEVAENLIIGSKAELKIIVQYNDNTKKIIPKQRFVFEGNAYEVATIDSISKVYLDSGLIELGVNFVSLTSTDDTTDDVADESGNSGWGDW